MKKCSLSLLLSTLVICGICQSIPIGTWQSHVSYYHIHQIVANDAFIYGAANHGIVYFNQNENELSTLTKAKGLSASGISAIGINNQYLMVGYEDGAMDVIADQNVRPILDLRDSDLAGSKRINDIAANNDRAYFASDFGILVVNLEDFSIIENYQNIGLGGTALSVDEVTLQNETLFALTSQGIQSGNITNNLLDFTQWTFYPNTQQLRNLDQGTAGLFATQDSSIYQFQNEEWNEVFKSTESISSLFISDSVHYSSGNSIYLWNGSGSELLTTKEDLTDFLIKDGIWKATSSSGILNPNDEGLVPNGPIGDRITHVKSQNGETFTFYADRIPSFNQATNLGYSQLQSGIWANETIPNFEFISDVAIYRGSLYFSSHLSGVFDYSNEQNIADQISVGQDTITVTSLFTEGILGATFYDNPNVAFSYLSGEEWTNIQPSQLGIQLPIDLKIAEGGTLWIQSLDNTGISAYNIDSEELNQINQGEGLPSSTVLDYDFSEDNAVWIATTRGIVSFPSASNPFMELSAIQPVFSGQVLLDDQEVSSVAVDGGNRVWIATEQGILVFDEGFNELIHEFTETNSPLPSNNVIQLTYNTTDGQMFILTKKGLASFRSGSSSVRFNHQNVEIFPNPVNTRFDGFIGIKNLISNTEVKITDLEGKLIMSLDPAGGTAAWDLYSYSGNRVSAGIYLVWIAAEGVDDTFVGKLAVIE